MNRTEAWLLFAGDQKPEPTELVRGNYSFSEPTAEEVLAEPIFGCWEANMTHALERLPVDICRQRREEMVILGNAGVVRILKTGASVTTVKEGDICGIVCVGTQDRYGNMLKVLGYDAPGSMGVLAKRIKLNQMQVARLPCNTEHSYQQWAAFGVRYATAWANWRVAYGSFRLQVSEDECPRPFVWGWGGGVALAELALSKFRGCRPFMIASKPERLELIRKMGIEPVDRKEFQDLDFNEELYRRNRDYKRRYLRAESRFLRCVRERTGGEGVSIFVENIGEPVFRATLRALGAQGVITTVGWRNGMNLSFRRAVECINRHTHVNTHGARYSQGLTSMHFAEQTGWMPPVDERVYSWDEIPELAKDFAEGNVVSYFPIFQINPL